MKIRSIALALLAALALAAAGCGKDEEGKPIPSSIASVLESRLQVIESQLDQGGGACADILTKTQPVVQRDLQRVPDDVDPDVRSALQASFDHLFDLAETQCDESSGQETTPTETETTPTQPEQTNTQDTATQQTETQQTQTQETQTPDQSPGKPKKDKGNQGNGNGGGAPAPEGN